MEVHDGQEGKDEEESGSAGGDSESSSSSESDSEPDIEQIVKVFNADQATETRRPAQGASTELFVHVRLGTLHLGCASKPQVLACERIKHPGYKAVDEPQFDWHKCKDCFGR